MKMTSFRIRPVIALFGDSLTQQGFGVDGGIGWASLLASAYCRRADVLNRGFSGYNTNHALELLPRVFGPMDNNAVSSGMLFCTIFFGANDAALPGEGQHVPIETYKENLGKLVRGVREHVKQEDHFPIILITPPPVDEAAWMKFRELEKTNRENAVTRSYGDVVQEVASQHNCFVVDSWGLLKGHSNDRGSYLSDGLHLNEAGNRLIYEGLMDLIRSKYPHLAPMEDDGKTGLPLEEKVWTDLI